MTGPDQYVPFMISRVFVGFFSATSTILGPQMLVEVFFLHERGTVINVLMVCSTTGTVIGPTLGGFIAQHAPWPWEFWWLVALQGATALLGKYSTESHDYEEKKLIRNVNRIRLPRRDWIHS